MWKAREQKGEMAYGQPAFDTPISREEFLSTVVSHPIGEYCKGLEIGKYEYQTTTKNLTTGDEKSTRYAQRFHCTIAFHFKYRYGKLWRRALWMGYSLKGILGVWFDRHKLSPNPRVFAVVKPSTFMDVEVAANYFGERLPNAFWERYAKGENPIISKTVSDGTLSK